MDNKKMGLILIVIALVVTGSTFMIKSREDAIIDKIIAEQKTCFLEDGTCLHDDRSLTPYVIAWVFSAALAALGAYLLFFEKSQKEIVSELGKQKEMKIEGEKFEILLKGLDADEKKVILAVKEQDGITQQTLRLRADLHKSKLSIVLDRLEKKGIIKRVLKGKTKQVFMKVKI